MWVCELLIDWTCSVLIINPRLLYSDPRTLNTCVMQECKQFYCICAKGCCKLNLIDSQNYFFKISVRDLLCIWLKHVYLCRSKIQCVWFYNHFSVFPPMLTLPKNNNNNYCINAILLLSPIHTPCPFLPKKICLIEFKISSCD